MRVILQAEAAECGLASIAMVLSYYNLNYQLPDLRAQFPQSLKGNTLKQLIEISSDLNFNSRPLQLEIAEINQLALPCILHWDLNHFVVLTKVSNKKVTIHDPAKGKVTLSINAFSKHFTGIALELSPNDSFNLTDMPPALSIKQIIPKFKGLASNLSQILLVSIMLQVFVLISPYYMQTIIDDVLVSYDYDLLFILAVGFGALVIFQQTFSFVRGFMIIHLGATISKQFTEILFNHLIRLPLNFFESRHVADIVSRFHSIESIKQVLAQKFVEACIDGFMAITTLIVIFVYQPKLAIIVVGIVIIYILIRWVFYNPLKRATEQVIETDATEQAHFMESIRGIQSIKLMSLEASRASQWLNKFVSSLNFRVKVEKMQMYFGTSSGLIFGLENIVIVFLGAELVIQSSGSGHFTLGMLMAFIAYKTQMTGRFITLTETFIQFRMLSVHLQRISDIALTTKEHTDSVVSAKRNRHDKIELTGRLEIKGLAFKYPQESHHVFSTLNLAINQGQKIALVAKSGQGKSTLLKLLLGLLPAEKNTIYYDDHELSVLGLKTLRRQSSSVMQNDKLLSGSIAENIANFEEPIDIDQVSRSAKTAQIHQDILGMPMQYETAIGEMGSALSGGQVQRILLARALYRDPKILFLDEATSNLDLPTESKINKEINKTGITVVFIAHRVESIQQADTVYELTQNALIDVSPQYLN